MNIHERSYNIELADGKLPMMDELENEHSETKEKSWETLMSDDRTTTPERVQKTRVHLDRIRGCLIGGAAALPTTMSADPIRTGCLHSRHPSWNEAPPAASPSC